MNVKDNQRTRITKMLIKQAYMQLIKEKQTAKITVKDICEKAEINRSTFYLHYTEPNSILIEIEDETIAALKETLFTIGSLEADEKNARNYLTSFLRYVRKNEDPLKTLLIENSDPHFRRKLLDASEEIAISTFKIPLPTEVQKPVYHFIVSGSFEVISDWIKNDYNIPEQKLCDILYTLNEGAMQKALS